MERVLADSGFVVALVNRTDQRHPDVVPIYEQYAQILLPPRWCWSKWLTSLVAMLAS